MKNILIIDGLNLIHRARVAMQDAEHGITFATLRSVRSLIDKFKPDVTYFVMEGVPRRRMLESEGTYKAQRTGMDETFKVQKRQIVDLISKHLPILVMRHPDHEADDVISHLAKSVHREDSVTIVSTDTDFIQLLNGSGRISLYSPIKDIMVEPTQYDYVMWKSLRGDKSDNIPGIPGIGDKRAQNLLVEPGALEQFFLKKPEAKPIFEGNLSLIAFEDLGCDWEHVTRSSPNRDEEVLRTRLQQLGFNSIANEKSWPKWIKTYDNLWSQFLSQTV